MERDYAVIKNQKQIAIIETTEAGETEEKTEKVAKEYKDTIDKEGENKS